VSAISETPNPGWNLKCSWLTSTTCRCEHRLHSHQKMHHMTNTVPNSCYPTPNARLGITLFRKAAVYYYGNNKKSNKKLSVSSITRV
jgi:hypothetical protein